MVISEIVVREIFKVRKQMAQKGLGKQRSVLQSLEKSGMLSEAKVVELWGLFEEMPSAETHAKAEIDAFLAACGADVIPADTIKVSDVVGSYFHQAPPFSSKGKKNEFPDAIALLSLEAWAETNDEVILAVSNDGDWKTYCESSERFGLKEDLGDAIASLAADAEAYLPLAKAVVEDLRKNPQGVAGEDFENALEFSVSNAFVFAEFDGPMPGEAEEVFLTLSSFDLLPDDDLEDVELMQMADDRFVARVPIMVKALLTALVSFSVYDSVDKDRVPMGSAEVERDVEFPASVLIHAHKEGDEDDGQDDSEWRIDRVELVDDPSGFDIGFVDYSLADKFGPDDWT